MSGILRIADLRALKDNWDGRNSRAPTKEAIDRAEQITAHPLGDGGLQLCLYSATLDVEIDISPVGKVAAVYFGER